MAKKKAKKLGKKSMKRTKGGLALSGGTARTIRGIDKSTPIIMKPLA